MQTFLSASSSSLRDCSRPEQTLIYPGVPPRRGSEGPETLILVCTLSAKYSVGAGGSVAERQGGGLESLTAAARDVRTSLMPSDMAGIYSG